MINKDKVAETFFSIDDSCKEFAQFISKLILGRYTIPH